MIFASFVTMSGQSGGQRVRLARLNEQLTCKLCGGYFIDATTIIECLHSFCKSCIVKYLENNKYCPICEVQVHKSRPLLNIRPDYTLQDIVYKLVPGCYQNEMRCRREFYAKHSEECNQAMSPEARGEPTESHIYSPDESLSLSLEYFNPNTKDLSEVNTTVKDSAQKSILRRYFRCPAAVTIFHLQKLIRAKYGLGDANRVDIMYKEEQLCSSYTLMDIMYIYHWRRKVPLHLSYRIFESSLKRMKLSEDNANYKNSLKDAGIDSLDLKGDKSLKREWKEVQLKISETGVMSITDISSTVHKRDAEIENLRDEKSSEKTITSIVEVSETDSLIGNCDVSKSSVEIIQSTLAIDPQLMKNPIFPNSSNAFLVTSDVKSTTENSSIKNCTSPITQHNGNTTKQGSETGSRTASAKLQEAREGKGRNQVANVEDKAGQKIVNQPVAQLTEEKANLVAENTDGKKKLSINNNNNSTDFKAETQKECVKSTSVQDTKTGNAGSKIDALSVKLQFQPKMGQVNNTYSKKTPKEKRATLQQGAKKSDVKSSTEGTKLTDTKTRTNCGNTTTKVSVSVSCSTATPPQKSIAITSRNASSTIDSATGGQETLYEKANPSTSIDVQQALTLLEQKTTVASSLQVSAESVPRTSSSHVTSTVNQRLQGTSSNNNNNNTTTTSEHVVSTSIPNVSTSTISQTTSSTTFPYTLHDIVINSAAVRPALKNSSASSNCTTLQKALGTPVVACSTSNSQASLMSPQFNVQTPSMSIYSVSMPLKSNQASQITTVTATSTATITVTASKPTSLCSVPPCPDAIPISLMKQASIRKQEATAKGTNLNEICAKIGSFGSKINDICAKIGENSKEKSRVEQARGKSDVPDLLKIGTKKSPSSSSSSSSSSSLPNSDSTIKHIPNIPNIPMYNPSSNATTLENKSAKPGLPVSALPISSTVTSLASTSSPQMSQRMSSLKKQSQPIGYKTLRDPPKSWNPTLSKNNYVAVKNQAKEMQNQTQTTSASEGTSKQIPSKPAKIFKMRNVPRYLGNPASGVKPMYGVTNEAKEKEQSAVANAKSATLNMMKIDPKTLSPIVSPPPYSPNARSYQNTPYSRDMCRSTSSPISPRNSPVNMLSTNPFIPSPTPNTNPRIIYSHFPPPFPDASRFPNPLIRSPIGIPPPSAFHSSLPPSINKLYQRSASYIPQTTGSYSPVSSQPPAVQRMPPSTHSSSPKSPKASSPSSISCTSFNMGKIAESQSPITSVADSVALLLSKNVPVPVSMSVPMPSLQRELNAFNLSKTGGSLGPTSNVVVAKTLDTSNADTIETQTAKQNAPSVSQNSGAIAEVSGNANVGERKHSKDADPVQKTTTQETGTTPKEESPSKTTKPTEARCNAEIVESSSADTKEKNQAAKVNGDVTTTDQLVSKKSKEANSNDEATTTTPVTETTERVAQVERSSSRERSSIPNSNAQDNNISDSPVNESKNDKSSEQIQGKKSEVQRNKAET